MGTASTRGRVSRPRRKGFRWVSTAVAGVLAAQLLAAPALASTQPPHGGAGRLSVAALRALHHLGPPAGHRTVAGHRDTQVAHRPGIPRAELARPAPPAGWPSAGTGSAGLTAAARARGAGSGSGWRQAGGLPVSVAPASAGGRAPADGASVSRVRVQMAGHAAAQAAGVAGVLFSVSRADGGTAAGPVRVRVDYAGFASAYGGGFGSRLTLVAMPGCVLTTPAVPACRQMRPLPAVNDSAARSLTAQVTAAPAGAATSTVIAATSSTSGGTGDFKATSLSPSSAWQVGLQSGDFTWSYPLRVPPPMGGTAPGLSLAYDSGSIDGETAQSNSQPGQLGEGFTLAGGGFIERKYAACADHVGDSSNTTDQNNKTGDLCWDGDNAYLNLDGRSTEIIHDAATGTWRLADDDGSTVQELTGADNGTHQGQYWKVTATDGTQYIFGMNKLPGFASGDQQTNSAWTVPVVGLKDGDPCHSATYTSAACTAMAWRWNLDAVIDPNGNTTEYYYNPETNYYSFDSYVNKSGTLVDGSKKPYTSGGTLASVVYGAQTPNVYSHQPFQVSFGYSDRCTSASQSTCDANHNGTYWPDTPWDLYCSSSSSNATCSGSGHEAPSFFDTQMLTSVTTAVDEGGSAPVKVDTWTLGYKWLSTDGDVEDLFLSSIQHTGDVGGSKSPGTVTFAPTEANNRVGGDGYPDMTRFRIGAITSETGAVTSITYNQPDCGSSRPTPSDDHLTCFQQWWSDQDIGGRMVESWFYKYTVAEVLVSDPTGGEPVMPTYYTYNNGNSGGAAWHYDTDIDLVKQKYKSYSQWRGYQNVSVVTGSTSGTQSETDYTFFRGMNGDPVYDSSAGTWGTQAATVTDSRGNTYTDSGRANGFLLEKITRNGPGGPKVSDQISQPWLSPATATSDQQPWGGTLTARLDGTAQADTYAPAVSGTRHTEVTSTFDPSTGLVTQTDDQGDVSVPSQELCTATSYAQNTAAGVNMVDFPKQVKVTSGPCGASSPLLVSNTRYLYDGGAFGDAPVSGNVTETDVYSANDPGVADHWVQQSRDTYDTYGRVTSSKDAAGNPTATSYTSSYGSGLATSKTVVTDPLGHTTTTNINPAWGSPAGTIDANGEETSYAYDPLGRLTSVWLPGQSQSAGDAASYTYSYHVSSSNPSIVTTSKLINASASLYVTSYTLLDSLLRTRQTQAPAEGVSGGTEVTDTFYDSRGNTVTQNGPYPISSAPSTCTTDPASCLYITTEPAIPNETASSYDGAGRLTEKDLDSYGALQWKTSYAYPGVDAVTVTPPAGGTATTTYTDARGHTSDIYQYHSTPPPASPPAAGTGSSPGPSGWDHASYSYTPTGQLAAITDPAGNSWADGYDLLGRQISTATPDSGTSTSTYNDLGQLTTATDARGKTISWAYDADGRKTAEYNTTGGAAQTGSDQLAAWTYDTPATGQLASATSYTGGTSGEAYTQAINSYDPAYQPTSTTYSIAGNTLNPALDGNYTFTAAYNTDGTIKTEGYPAGGGLPAETVTHGYDNLGSPYSLFSNLASNTQDYVMQSFYTPDGQPAETDLGTAQSSQWSRIVDSYDPATARLTESRIQQENTNWANATDTSYSYDNAGDVTSISDSVSSDTQCLNYDYAQRLTAAWAQTSSTCPQTPPGPGGTGGPAPYLQKLTYDSSSAGNITEDDLTVPGTTSDTTLTYPQPGQAQPHTPTTITSTIDGTATTTNPGYTPAGDLSTTGTGATAQTLTWNAAGQLTTISDGTSDTTHYRYDATGSQLLRQDNNTTTLYLPGEELTATASTLTATRYYTHGGQIIAARTPAGLSWLFADPHGTDTVAVNTGNQHLTQNRYTPFGAPRGTPPTNWPGDHGFVGGTTDTTTSLTNLGAREYNPTQATFISPDPLQTPYTPQNLNPYDYAQANPATMSDPTGLLRTCGVDLNCGGGGDTNPSPSHHSSGPPPSSGGGGSSCPLIELSCSGGDGNYGSSTTGYYDPPTSSLFELPPSPPVVIRSPSPTVVRPGVSPCLSNLINLGCGPAGKAGWGVTDTAGLGTTGLGALGRFSSQAGGDLGNADLTPAERSAAGARMSYLARNPGWDDAATLGRAVPLLRAGSGTLIAVGGLLTIWGYRSAGDPWWKAVGKGVITTGGSLLGAIGGSMLGVTAGAALPGPDVTGIPEVTGAVAGAVGGGLLGGSLANDLGSFLFGP